MDLGGQVPVSEYFADMTLKKQLAVSVLFQFQVAVADFILVSSFVPVRSSHYFRREGVGVSFVSCVEALLVALHYPRSGMVWCLE